MEPIVNAVIEYMIDNRINIENASHVKIRNIRSVRVDEIKDMPPQEVKAYSGKPFIISPKGVISISEKLDNGAQNVELGFQVTLTCIFNAEEEKFVIQQEANLLAYKK